VFRETIADCRAEAICRTHRGRSLGPWASLPEVLDHHQLAALVLHLRVQDRLPKGVPKPVRPCSSRERQSTPRESQNRPRRPARCGRRGRSRPPVRPALLPGCSWAMPRSTRASWTRSSTRRFAGSSRARRGVGATKVRGGTTPERNHRSRTRRHAHPFDWARRGLLGFGPAFGPLAQLGERLVRNQEVGGSSPPRSTNLRNRACPGVSQG